MPAKGKILTGKTPKRPPMRGKPVTPKPLGKVVSRKLENTSQKGFGAAPKKAAPRGKANAQFPRGQEILGSSIRPGLDKMSNTGTTTNTNQRGGGVSVFTGGRGTFRYANPVDVVGKMNADRAYGKGLLNEQAAKDRENANRKAGRKRRGLDKMGTTTGASGLAWTENNGSARAQLVDRTGYRNASRAYGLGKLRRGGK